MMEKLQIGFIGLGARGRNLLVNVLKHFSDVDVVAVCDRYEDRAQDAATRVVEEGRPAPACYTDYRKLLADEQVNTVIIAASWEDHVPLAVASMRAGKVTALEVGGA